MTHSPFGLSLLPFFRLTRMALFATVLICPALATVAEAASDRWTAEKANEWYDAQPWLVGCNFTPSSAINQLEMWQADTFDPETIDRELGYAAGLGMNTVRTYLHDLAWQADPVGFKERLDHFLDLCAKHGIRPMLVFFDDCWNAEPKVGKQPEPVPSVHNSGWVQSPGRAVVNDPAQWGRLEAYVKDVVGSFHDDDRILIWDVYNEPGNTGQGTRSLPLLVKAFEWARAMEPTQPLTSAVFGKLEDRPAINAYLKEASDIISLHHYQNLERLKAKVDTLKQHGRPLISSEWLARGKSNVADQLPYYHAQGIGVYNWGLVSGKTNTIYRWGTKEGAPEPELWHHDLLRKDGTPFDSAEAALFRQLTKSKP